MKHNPEQRIVLASSSPYRKQLLQKLELCFTTADPKVDETTKPNESPRQQAERLAIMKAKALAPDFPRHMIIGSDQVAMLQSEQLTKPGNRDNAITQLKKASANCVEFNTSVCIYDTSTDKYQVVTDFCKVYFRKLNNEQITRYIDIDRPYQCAGSFKAEGLGIALIERIEGDDPNALVGLPLILLVGLLGEFGVRII